MFWIVAFFLTVVVLAAVLWPLLRKPALLPTRAEHDAEVYGAQLRELNGDLERGTIARDEATSARAEIGRRLLRSISGEDDPVGRRSGGSNRAASIAALLVVAATVTAALPFYAFTGRSNEPDMPLASRLAVDPARADVPTLIAKAEARLRENPEDGRGWDALLPLYLRLGRTDDALRAADNAIRLLGPTAGREVLRGEARMRSAGGEITDAAKASFEAALRLEAGNGPARFYLALRSGQKGDLEDARARWRALVDAGPSDAPWMEASRMALAAIEQGSAAAPSGAGPGPSAADIESAGRLSGEDRAAMVQGMVSQLAARLDSAPNDPDGWKRLIRSYTVLGDTGQARAAHEKARSVFADGSPERRSIDEFAEALGLGDNKAVQ